MPRKTLLYILTFVSLAVSGWPSLALAQGLDASSLGAQVTARQDLHPVLWKGPGVLTGPGTQPGFPARFWTNAPATLIPSEYSPGDMSVEISKALIALGDPKTKLAPSHTGHPGFQDAAFLYDKAVDALVLKAAGADQEARSILDYFALKLDIPMSEVVRNADANGIYGILKLYPSVDHPQTLSVVNAFSIRSQEREGEGKVEYWTTPGPLAFMVMAFLNVDRVKYFPAALKLGETLLAMQREDGGITDGDRDARNIHTEPHMDSLSAFLMLYDVTGDKKWQQAADRAWTWFVKNVYRSASGVVYQGIRPSGPSEIFATDAYSWTMAGRGGDRLSLDDLARLTDQMLKKSLSQVTLELPDGKTKALTLVDFSDARDMRLVADRGGYHPMGSVEWVGGVILALQKNAVRFWEAGDARHRDQARVYKAMAEFLNTQAMNSFYTLEGLDGMISFYATGQWIATGHGWKTPYFYVKDKDGNPMIKGGSTIGW